MYCPNCQVQNETHKRFCANCRNFLVSSNRGTRASIPARFVAMTIDTFFLGLFFTTLNAALTMTMGNTGTIVYGLISLAYFIFFLVLLARGLTPGKIVMGLRVITDRYAENPGCLTMFIREFIGKTISMLVFMLGYLWAIIDSDNQAWHDKIASTAVIKEYYTVRKNHAVAVATAAALVAIVWAGSFAAILVKGISAEGGPSLSKMTGVVDSVRQGKMPDPREMMDLDGMELDEMVEKGREAVKKPKERSPASTLEPPAFIVFAATTAFEDRARQKAQKLETEDRPAGYLWIPDYESLDGEEAFLVYLGPFRDMNSAKAALIRYKYENPDAYGIMLSRSGGKVRF